MNEKYLTKEQLEWLSMMSVEYDIDDTSIVIRIKLGTKFMAEKALEQLNKRG